nr:class 1a viroporin-like protein [Colocasia bobone disease-associated virus]
MFGFLFEYLPYIIVIFHLSVLCSMIMWRVKGRILRYCLKQLVKEEEGLLRHY